ncbi:hypothetical protein F4859DRAFT_509246 [Xylaria cf. heliscus]|nr:hypothetical protein F4859DRAFT_509246 [Xylaria cf. heliscus]
MPRAKRSKQYKRLMNQYEMNFGFREPYQVLCDSQFLEAAIRSKMDIDHILKTTLHGNTKLLISQCSMRWLYARKNDPGIGAVIDFAKEKIERRRCGHHPSDYPEPLKELDCLHSVVDPSKNGVNKHRYVCAINDDEVRSSLRDGIQVVPLLYIRRSVLIMEPASSTTVKARSRDEKAKFTAELKSPGMKRKRQQEDTDDEKGDNDIEEGTELSKPKKKKTYGRKEPNPLSVRKKKREDKPQHVKNRSTETAEAAELAEAMQDNTTQPETGEASGRKRRRKHKSKATNTAERVGDIQCTGSNVGNAKRRLESQHFDRFAGPQIMLQVDNSFSKVQVQVQPQAQAPAPLPESNKADIRRHAHAQNTEAPMAAADVPEVDDFGLPIPKYVSPVDDDDKGEPEPAGATARALESGAAPKVPDATRNASLQTERPDMPRNGDGSNPVDGASASAAPTKASESSISEPPKQDTCDIPSTSKETAPSEPGKNSQASEVSSPQSRGHPSSNTAKRRSTLSKDTQAISGPSIKEIQANKQAAEAEKAPHLTHSRDASAASHNLEVSEFSHQQLTSTKEKEDEDGDEDDGWQTMPAYAPYDIYDDDNRLIAKEHNPDEDDTYGYAGLGGAGKGYTRVIDDEDAESETSMDDNTRYLFNNVKSTSMTEMDEEQRDAVSQLQATKDLLTEGQRIAYVGIARLEMAGMVKDVEHVDRLKRAKKDVQLAVEALKMWSQKIMVRLYAHMDISSAEQIMIEQLSDHGVQPFDLTPTLMQNARVKNPMAETTPASTPKISRKSTPRLSVSSDASQEASVGPPPPYESHEGDEMPEVKTPSQLPSTENIDIDLRWTVLCDLFLVLIADGIYDARSRVLLERVGKDLEVPWIDICRFEKRVTDALEMQQQAEQENWNEEEHLENRRKLALRKRYVMMGLATVGGGLVIGLSAGLLAPLIGAGLAAGFTTIGVGGTSSFLAGAGGAAIITSSAAASGSFMGGKAAGRRTGAVKTFEYRPLNNNKRVNLILTISGWLTSKVDDVRLPFSTVDPIMGDLYSILWEPELLTSMGDTINILATEALTQGLQQVLGSTILISLMAALQLPVVLSKLAYLIDNPWAVSLDRAWAAGLVLADSLIDRNLGTRPITLVGYSLGSRVIFSCLLELARKGAHGLVQNVYLFGAPIVVKKEEFVKARVVVAGRFVNGYNRNDWILGYLFRLTNGGIRRIAGLATVDEIPEVENFDCTKLVGGHMEYRSAMPRLLRECGWVVESDEFGEIEDPDPDRHRERQIELINEIEEARKELEKEGQSKKGKGGWGIFGRKKKAERQDWEIYEDSKRADESRNGEKSGSNNGVLFDVDAMRAELARDEELQVKELASTLPPIKLDVSSSTQSSPRDMLRETKSVDGTMAWRSGEFDEHSFQHEQDDIRMTFDTAFRDPEPPLPPGKDYVNAPGPARPEIKTAHTTPNLALDDPWADEDEDFGKEKEISMTFA